MAEDLCITRTRRRLKQALLELIDEVGYESITIEQLTDFDKTIVRGPSHRVRRRLKEILATVAERKLVASGRAQQGEGTAVARGRAIAGSFLGLVEWWFARPETRRVRRTS